MTSQKTFKRRVRARAGKTGESFTTARAQLIAHAERNVSEPATKPAPAAEPPAEPATEMPVSDEAITRGTGHGWAHWLAVLDEWGAATQRHTEIARYVNEVLGVDGWWSQSVTVGFERARGLRATNQRRDEGFYLSSSVTVNVPIERLSEAWLDESTRAKWLTPGMLRARTARPNKSASFDWGDPPSRVVLGLTAKGPSKSQASIEHSRLPNGEAVAEMRALWKARFRELKARLEG